MNSIYLPSEVNTQNIEFGNITALKTGGKSVNLRYEGRNLTLETPNLNIPYGVNNKSFDGNGPVKYSIDLSLRGADENDDIRALRSFLEAFDEFMINAGIQNAEKWLGKKNPSRELIVDKYKPVLKVSLDADGNEKYPPTFKANLRKNKEDKFETAFYNGTERNDKGEPVLYDADVPIENILAKRSNVTAVIECTGIWIAGGNFGTTWKAKRIRVNSSPVQTSGPIFRSDAPDITAFVAKTTSNAAAEDSDNENNGGHVNDVVAAVMPTKNKPASNPVATFKEEQVVEPAPVPTAPKKFGGAKKATSGK
jgi:hypothetical protein